MEPGIAGNDHFGVEQGVRVEQGFDPAHDAPGGIAPFLPDKGRHIATGAVFGLQRAIVFSGHQITDFLHEGIVTGHGLGTVETRREHKVQVAVQRVTEQQRLVVTVFVEQCGQAAYPVGQILDREGHILDDHGGALRTHRTDGRKHALAQRPVGLAFAGIGAEAAGNAWREAGEQGVDGLTVLRQFAGGGGTGLDQQAGTAIAHRFIEEVRQSRFVLHCADTAAVDQLDGIDRRPAAQGRDRPATGVQLVEQHQCRGFVRMIGHGVEGDFADKGQRSFGADQQMAEDVDRVAEIQQGIDTVAGGVFQAVLAAYPLGKLRVGRQLCREFGQAVQQAGVRLAEGRDAVSVGGIQHGAVSQHRPQGVQSVVAIVTGAATHAAGVVGGHATDFGGIDRGRVRADLAPERYQHGIGVGTDHARGQSNALAVIQYFAVVEAVAEHHQHRVADRLAGQTGAGGTKGDRYAVPVGQCHYLAYLLLVIDFDHHLRDQAIEAAVRAIRQSRQGIGIDTPGRQMAGKVTGKGPVSGCQAIGSHDSLRRASRSRTSSCRVLGAGVIGTWFCVQPAWVGGVRARSRVALQPNSR